MSQQSKSNGDEDLNLPMGVMTQEAWLNYNSQEEATNKAPSHNNHPTSYILDPSSPTGYQTVYGAVTNSTISSEHSGASMFKPSHITPNCTTMPSGMPSHVPNLTPTHMPNVTPNHMPNVTPNNRSMPNSSMMSSSAGPAPNSTVTTLDLAATTPGLADSSSKSTTTGAATAKGIFNFDSVCDSSDDSEPEEDVELTLEQEISLCNVSDTEWVSTIQEESVIQKDSSKTLTAKRMNPKLWNMVTKLAQQWEGWHWYRAQRGNKLDPKTNKMKKLNNVDMKSQAVRHILNRRQKMPRSKILDKYFGANEPIRTTTSTTSEATYWFLSKTEFLTWANEMYKVDVKAKEEKERCTPNDIIRIFGIACSSFARDDITKITEAKASKRADLDGPMSYLDAIFTKCQEKFNDPSFELSIPARANQVESYTELDPNSLTRINIVRSYRWIKGAYFKVLKEYSHAMSKWKMGTGGGSGAPEDFAGSWRERENLELFANYASQAGKCDYLAYILMYDKEVDYIIDSINDPAPPRNHNGKWYCWGEG